MPAQYSLSLPGENEWGLRCQARAAVQEGPLRRSVA